MAKVTTAVPAKKVEATQGNTPQVDPLSIIEENELRIVELNQIVAEQAHKIDKLELQLAEKDALIDELQAAIEAKDSSSLEVAKYPTVTHEGVTYEVRARKLKLRGDSATYTLDALKDPAFVAKLVEMKAGYLVPVS